MKHFGAVLTGDANIVDGGESSILTIGSDALNNDTIVIHNDNTTTGMTDASSDGSVAGLVIVPSTAGRGATHILGADGREVAITSVGGGINDNLIVPISTGTTFVNSRISQSITAATGDATITIGGGTTSDTVIVRGDLQVTGTTTTVDSTTVTVADRFINLGTTAATTTTSDLTGGIIVETDNDGAGVKSYGGLRYNGATNTWQVSSAPLETGLAADSAWSDLGVAGAGVQTVVGGAGISVNATDANNPIVSTAITPLGTGGTGGLALVGTGAAATLSIAAEGITEQHLHSTNTGGVGQLLSLQNATTGEFEWVTGNTGTVQKYVHTGTKAAGDTGIEITNATHMLAGQDYTVICYELIVDAVGANGGYQQFIPESVLIQDGTGTGTAGNVIITTGATTENLSYKIVIKS